MLQNEGPGRSIAGSCATAASAQPPEVPLSLARLTGPVVVDGRPDEDAWQAVDPLPLTMYFPTHRGRPSQRTEIRVGYDDDHLIEIYQASDDKQIKKKALNYLSMMGSKKATQIFQDILEEQ